MIVGVVVVNDDERMGEGGRWESMDGDEMSAVVVEDDDDEDKVLF